MINNGFSQPFYESRLWLNALYYEKVQDGFASLADSERFFITEDGKTNPKLEYEASFLLVSNQDLEFKTRFPYRYKIIAEANQIKYEPSVHVDPNIESAVIVFPNRYMENPASMFGHLFIILKSKQGILDSNIVHFIASTGDINQFSYIYYGLSGKFKGGFLVEPYYKKIKEYNYVEDREVDYYSLQLNTDTVTDMQLHAIDLRQTYFDYYFFDENCAYFIAKYLNNFLPEDIIERRSIIYPSQIVNQLNKKGHLLTEFNRKPMVKLFGETYSDLSREQKKQVLLLLTDVVEPIPHDKDVLKAFIYISEYFINNQPNYAQIIRQNRISAYRYLKQQNDSNVRPDFVIQTPVQSIKSKGI